MLVFGFCNCNEKQSLFSRSLRSLLSPLPISKPPASISVPWDHACLAEKQKAVQFGGRAPVLNTKANCTHFLGRARPRRRGSHTLMVCVPPLYRSSQPPVQFPEGILCVETVPGVLWTAGNRQELEGIYSFPKMPPTNPSCLQYLCKAAYTGYEHPWLLCTSLGSTVCSFAALLPVNYHPGF